MGREKKIRIGTSGWSYRHWRGAFFPDGLPASRQFQHYSGLFDTVELNSPFYRLPSHGAFQAWRDKSPEGFDFAVKASRFISHMKKLSDPVESSARFLENVAGLGEKCGPILFQLPPGWNVNVERFASFASRLPGHFRYVFEFRNPSWHHPEIYAVMRQYACGFCIFDLDGYLSPLEITSDLVYVRLHGPQKYAGSYSHEVLRQWAGRCTEWAAHADVYVYFDNDIGAHAPFNASELQTMVKKIM